MNQQLKTAAKRGHVDQIRRLLEKGEGDDDDSSSVMAKDVNGCTPLHLAIRYNTNGNDVVALLLDKGADINDQDYKGWTPLHRACIHGRVSVACLLLERGADPTIKDRNGKTPFDVAVSSCSSLAFIIKNTNALNHQIDTLTNEKAILVEQVDMLSGEKAELLQENETLMHDTQTWQTRHQEMEQTAFSLQEQNNMFQSQMDILLNEKKILEHQVVTLSRATTELLQESEILTQEVETWETAYDEMKQKSDLYQMQIDNLTIENKTLVEQIQMLSMEQTELSKENEILTQENYNWIHRHEVMKQKADNFMEQMKMCQIQNELLLEQTTQLKTSLIQLKKSHQKEEQLQVEISKLQETVRRQQQKEYERLQIEYAHVLQKLATLQRKQQPEHQVAQTHRQEHGNTTLRQDSNHRREDVETPPSDAKPVPKVTDHYTNNGEVKDKLISIESSLSDELVSVMMVTDNNRYRDDEVWTEIADDLDSVNQQQESISTSSSSMLMMGAVATSGNHYDIVSQAESPQVDLMVMDQVVANSITTTDDENSTTASWKGDDDKQKIAKIHEFIETLMLG